MADWLSGRLLQPVIIDNKPGASGNLAVHEAIKSAPDGHTLLLVPASAIVNRALFAKLPFDVLVDVAPVSGLVEFALVLLINPSIRADNLEEFIAYANANPGTLNLASFGSGTTSHLAGELFQMMTGTKMTHIPYPGEAAAFTDLISGRVHVMFAVLTTSLSHIRAGTLKPLAMAGRRRHPLLPDLPTIAETISGYDANSWLGVGVPKETNNEVVAFLNREINLGLIDPEMKARFANLAITPILFTPEEFGHYMAAEAAKWAQVVSQVGLFESR
jgi:tripartite-type tricarboxylate transporter receptor subunit TctC